MAGLVQRVIVRVRDRMRGLTLLKLVFENDDRREAHRVGQTSFVVFV